MLYKYLRLVSGYFAALPPFITVSILTNTQIEVYVIKIPTILSLPKRLMLVISGEINVHRSPLISHISLATQGHRVKDTITKIHVKLF